VILKPIWSGPSVNEIPVMLGPTVNCIPLLATPPTVTITLPVVAPDGTFTVIEVALQVVAVPAETPLNLTVLVPCVDPKFVPVIVTATPVGPPDGDRLVIVGPVPTAKYIPLLGVLPTVTTTLPEVAPVGTLITMEDADQVVAVPAGVLLKVTVLVPWVDPKFAPLMVTLVPTAPEFGDRAVIAGALPTTNITPLLVYPFVITTTLPVVAPCGTGATMVDELQLFGLAGVPLKVTMPGTEPKFAPLIVTDVPTEPEDGLKGGVMTGGG